jgi:DNA-3-methyladenine glycosylase
MDSSDSPVTVARRLIGQFLCRRTRQGLCVGRIVETEAYLSEGDSAAHSFRGPNRKNDSMFGPAGRAYIYTIHARQCVNVVTEREGIGSAVLIRAVEPLEGIPLMQRRRRTDRCRDLCRGPARLCEAFQIGRDLDGWNLNRGSRLWIREVCHEASTIPAYSPRIGVTSAKDLLLRFFVSHSEFVSGTRIQNRVECLQGRDTVPTRNRTCGCS